MAKSSRNRQASPTPPRPTAESDAQTRHLDDLQRRVSLLEKRKSRIALLITIVIPIASLGIAALALLTSRDALELSERAFAVSVEPEVYASVHYDRHAPLCTLLVENQGIYPVVDVRIRKYLTNIDLLSKKRGGILSSRGDWQQVDSLPPGGHYAFALDSDDVSHAIQFARFERKYSGPEVRYPVPTFAFYTTYRRTPDKRSYRFRTLLFVFADLEKDKFQWFATEDDIWSSSFAQMGPTLDSLFIRR